MQRTDEKKTVGVVLVNWNGADLTIPCIGSLLAGITVPDSIVVVDNASTDGSADQIASQYPGVVVIRNKENTGFTGGNNIGIRQLLDEGMDFIWLLNNDTEVEKGCLKVLIDFMEREKNVAGCCGKILYNDRRDVIWYGGATYNPLMISARHKGQLQKDDGKYDLPEETQFITGCCMFVRADAWQIVGLFDEQFFAYSEDLDWCLRAGRKVMRLAYIPQAVIYHKVSSSMQKIHLTPNSGTTPPLVVYLANRNRIFIIRKYSKTILQWTVNVLWQACWLSYYALMLCILRRFHKLDALARAIRDGMVSSVSFKS